MATLPKIKIIEKLSNQICQTVTKIIYKHHMSLKGNPKMLSGEILAIVTLRI
jgi:hypothetical protein